MMLRVGQNPRNGQHLSLITRFENNRNQFNIFNSYFGSNSVYKNCFDYPNHGFIGISESYQQPIGGNGFKRNPKSRADNKPIVIDSNEWPTIEESFGTTPKPQTPQCLQWPKPLPPAELAIDSSPSIDVESPHKMLTTTFWDNINKMAELNSNNNNSDLNNNVDNDWGYVTESVGTSNKEWRFGSQTKEQSIDTPLKTDFWSNGYKTRQNSLETIDGSVEDLIVSNVCKIAKSWYNQPKIRRRQPSQIECVFCKNNNERPEFYRSHILKDPESNILCPILRAYDCPICHNGGGPRAHTVRYCPLNKAGIQSKMERMMKFQKLSPLIPDC